MCTVEEEEEEEEEEARNPSFLATSLHSLVDLFLCHVALKPLSFVTLLNYAASSQLYCGLYLPVGSRRHLKPALSVSGLSSFVETTEFIGHWGLGCFSLGHPTTGLLQTGPTTGLLQTGPTTGLLQTGPTTGLLQTGPTT